MKLNLLSKAVTLVLLFNSKLFAADYNSPFDIVNEINTNSDMKLGNFYNHAKLKAIDKKLGKVEIIDLVIGQTIQYNETAISLISCWREKASRYRSDNRAMIEFIQVKDGIRSDVFSGWIFSLNPGISRYNNENYEFILDSCSKS